ncbi:hypothetical protein BVRB_018800 [Beta vulgaris subsp. vulgaris]|uniref:Uncharacterized protein n=1 Tax=Beta vulgaris subsp. vulgaris TaxID=3555 RepID=A0A0J7YN75_BETVV|nr:hypothetical protein BVRB_018800 [Beta vulgaris subsp. vulgaris]
MKTREPSANLQIVCQIEPFSGEPSAMKTRKHQQRRRRPDNTNNGAEVLRIP